MSSLTMEVESLSGEQKNRALVQWVEEIAALCKPERVHWCDGTQDEYQAMLRLMTMAGTAIPLNPRRRA